MEKIQEIIVVEGKDDTRRLKEVFDVDTIETIGSAINEEILEKIRLAQEKRGVIVFTDPDFSGEKIRKTIIEHVPDVKHAFLTKKEGQGQGKKKIVSLGVEHASDEALKRALSKVYTPKREPNVCIPFFELQALKLISGPQAKKRRQYLGEALGIGYTNGKQLQKRLAMFTITKEQVKKVLENIGEGNE